MTSPLQEPFQPSLFVPQVGRVPATPYVSGSETSRAAAVSMRDHVGDQALQVFAAFKARGVRGATCDEVEEITGLPHQSASARVNWLKDSKRSWIIDSGKTRATRSGRQATVWVARAAAGEVEWPDT